MRPFTELIVWQKAHQLVLRLYDETREFPRYELYGLTSQIRRAGTSIPANIAEGSARSGRREFRQFLLMALGSAAELEYHLILARDLRYLLPEAQLELNAQLAEVKRMLVAFIARLDKPPSI